MRLKKKAEELEVYYDTQLKELIGEYNSLKSEIDDLIKRCDAAINVANAIRVELFPLIKKMYKSLSQIGNTGTPITPFDYNYDYFPSLEEEIKKCAKNEDIKNIELSNNKTGKVALVAAFIAPIPALITATTSEIIHHHKNQKKLEEYELKCKNIISKAEKHNEDMKDLKKFAEAAIIIADLYRGIVLSVKTIIEETILPEIGGIEACLYAEPIKECILYDTPISEANAMDISTCFYGQYSQHYQFVQNTVDYYSFICNVFKKSILHDIFKDFRVTQEEFERVKNFSEGNEKRIDNLKHLCLFTGDKK